MRYCGEDCKYFMKLANSDECGIAICSFPDSYCQIKIGNECAIMPKPYKCKDCSHFGTDYACLTVAPEESAYMSDGNLCIGFSTAEEEAVEGFIADKLLRGEDVKTLFNEKYQQVKERFSDFIQP